MYQNQNSWLRLSIDQNDGTFSITPDSQGYPAVQNATLQIVGHDASKSFNLPLALDPNTIQTHREGWITAPTHQQISILPRSRWGDLDCRIFFSVPKDAPCLMWKMVVHNRGRQPLWLDRLDMLTQPQRNGPATLKMNCAPEQLGFFVNGWQSWSFSGLSTQRSPQMHSHLGLLQEPMVVDAGQRGGGRYSSAADMFAVLVDRSSQQGALFGYLSQKEQFGHITLDGWRNPSIHMWADMDGVRLDANMSITTDWAVYMLTNGSDSESITPYLNLVTNENKVSTQLDVPTGWCSWYQYYQDISAETIYQNLEILKKRKDDLPLQLIQIDDGYQKEVGDWLTFRAGFPDGMNPVAQEIRRNGFTPGVWLAPFIMHRKSDLFHAHPDWILRKRNGKPVNAGFVWNSLGTALDLTHPDAMQYVRDVIHTAVQDWDFPYLKLDFLYAAALPGHYQNETKTRAQVLREGLEVIRESAGKRTYLVGCGLPLGSAVGIVDSMRIGPDVSGSWKPKFFKIAFPFKEEPSMPSARNSLRNVLTRANLHDRWWVNDPDCVLVRDQSELTLAEVQTLSTAIGMSGGSMIFSDDLTALSEERLRMAAGLLPPVHERLRVLDWLQRQYPEFLRLDMEGAVGEWYVLANINWDDRECTRSLSVDDFNIAADSYWISDYWAKKIQRNHTPTSLGEFTIPAHGCVLLAVRKVQEDRIQYLGSDLHFTQGQEVKKVTIKRKRVKFLMDAQRTTSGMIHFSIPARLTLLQSTQDIANFYPSYEGIYSLEVGADPTVEIELKIK